MLFCSLAVAALLASANLLENGGFEWVATPGGLPEGWEAWAPEGVLAVQDTTVRHSQAASLRLEVSPAAAVNWYQVRRPVAAVRRGASYTLSVYVRTEDVRDGAGAYISLNAFDGQGKRIGVFDSPQKLTGARDWVRVVTTAPVPDGTSELVAILTLHGHGAAWFDDAQVEEGLEPTPYQPSEAERVRAARIAAEREAAAPWLAALPPRRAGQARVAVLDLGLGNRTTPTSQPSDPTVLAAALTAAGHVAVRANAEQVANGAFLDPLHLDLLVVPTGEVFPAAAREALIGYLRRGGLLLTTGGYAFDRQVVPYQDGWRDPAELPPGDEPATPIFPAGMNGWSASSNREEKPHLEPVTGPGGEPGLAVVTPELTGWDTAISPDLAGKLPTGWSITRFWARGDARTPRMWVEWSETDGSRWHRAVELGAEWREYFVYPADLSYWHDNPSVGRGGAGDRFRPAEAARLQFGVAADIARKGEPHRVELAGVRVQVDPFAAMRVPAAPLNTRVARIRDAMWPTPEQLGIFDPSFPLREVSEIRAAAGQDVVRSYAAPGPLSGWAATAMLGLNGHGFGPNRARWIPLLESTGPDGEPRGPVAALVHHFAGTYQGSSWAIFGATDRDLFAAGAPGLTELLAPTAAALLRRLYLHETTTSYACYRPGETPQLRTRVSNHGPAPREVAVRFVVADEATEWRALTVPAHQTVDVELAWPLPSEPRDYYPYRAELRADGERVDQEAGAFVVWSPELLARGPKLTADGSRFLVDGRPQFLMGCQSYWGQNGSYTARSPLAFEQDFRAMRAHGLRWTRLFLPFRTEEDKRVSDAVVQLAQKHGLVLYHTPNLANTADPKVLAEQAATAREIAERYRGVPGLAVDICNEPTFRAADEALVAACGGGAPLTGPFEDLAITRFWRAAMRLQREWAANNLAAIHAGDPTRLASVGWSQGWDGWETMKDPITASLDLDFTDRHYYGDPAGLTPELRDLDLRGLGKPLVLGECGAKNHPTYRAQDPWGMGDDDPSYDRRFLYLGHHAFGLGAAVMSSWHWRDPIEGIFPCGLAYSTGVPRPTAAVYRAMAIAFGAIEPLPGRPEVVLLLPDEGRMSGQRAVTIRAFHRAAELLASARVDVTCLPDSALDRLPGGVRAIVYPVPPAAGDETIERLVQFVEGGGALYLSADPALDTDRVTVRPERLQRLGGVLATGDRPTLARPPAAGRLEPVAGSGLAAGEAHPAVTLTLAGAEMLASCAGQPVVTRYRLGQGQVWFSADPIELAPVADAADRALYCRFLEAAGVERVPVSPDTAELHAFRVRGAEADAWVLYNTAPAPVAAEVAGCRLALAADRPGWLLRGHDGGVRGVEAQGVVEQEGRPLARIDGHAFLLARDGRPLSESGAVLVMPVAATVVAWRSTQPAFGVRTMRFENGRWVPEAARGVTLRQVEGWVELTIPATSRAIYAVTHE